MKKIPFWQANKLRVLFGNPRIKCSTLRVLHGRPQGSARSDRDLQFNFQKFSFPVPMLRSNQTANDGFDTVAHRGHPNIFFD